MIKDYVAFDLETSGLSPAEDEIIEIGALKVRDGKVVDRFIEFVKPENPIPTSITQITGITNAMVADARDTKEIMCDFVSFCGDDVLLGHNILFDYSFCKNYAKRYGHPFEKQGIDTLKIARKVHKELPSKSLGALCAYYELVNQAAHRAYHDALATAKLYQCLAHHFEEKEPKLFVPVQLQYKQKKAQPATKKQLDFLQALCEQNEIQMNSIDALTRSEASKMIDRILSGDWRNGL
ncbi:MAG: 3'-5' exonuclease [Faecalimonas sp.]|nr:3'-5' exonuclease [Faecalimonas sp.]